MANSPKNDRLSSAEPCALYYFPEIPNTVNSETKTVSPERFTSGPFNGRDEKTPEETNQPDSEQIQSLIEEALNRGLEQGRAEVNAAQEAQINKAVAAFEAAIKEIHRVRRDDIERMESETVRLALAIAKKIIGHEAEHDATVQHVVKQAMEKVNDTRQLVIKLNPQDLAAVQDLQQELLPADDLGATLRIEGDEGIKRGGCVIETKLGDVDARIDQQLKIIEELLVDQLPKPTMQE